MQKLREEKTKLNKKKKQPYFDIKFILFEKLMFFSRFSLYKLRYEKKNQKIIRREKLL
jgi:hypothetical protein